MIDRYGVPIVVGWSAHQLIWIRAAMTLDGHERREAFQDIADLTGRSYASVYRMQAKLAMEDREKRMRQFRLERLTTASKRYLAQQTAAE